MRQPRGGQDRVLRVSGLGHAISPVSVGDSNCGHIKTDQMVQEMIVSAP